MSESNNTKRFSKSTLLEHVEAQMMVLEERWGIDPMNGTSQLSERGTDAVIGYGEWRALSELRERLQGWHYDASDWMTYERADQIVDRMRNDAASADIVVVYTDGQAQITLNTVLGRTAYADWSGRPTQPNERQQLSYMKATRMVQAARHYGATVNTRHARDEAQA